MTDQSFASESEHARRVGARRLLQGDRRPAVADRVLCARCKARIVGRRPQAKYCCERCKNAHRWEQRDLLRLEIKRAIRLERAPTRCPVCGESLDQTIKAGPPPTGHKRCLKRLWQRKYRNLEKEEDRRR